MPTTGCFFSGPPLNSHSTKSLYKLWHEKLWASLHGILYLENSGRVQKKNTLYEMHTVKCLPWNPTVKCILWDSYCEMPTVNWTLWNAHCEIYTVKCLPWNAYLELHTVKCISWQKKLRQIVEYKLLIKVYSFSEKLYIWKCLQIWMFTIMDIALNII